MSSRRISFVITGLALFALAEPVLAGGSHHSSSSSSSKPTSSGNTQVTTTVQANPTAVSGSRSKSTSNSTAKSNARSNSKSNAKSTATGGTATAAGGKADANQSLTNTNTAAGGAGGQATAASGDSSANANGQQAINQVYEQVRQTPPVILPTIIANDCGTGANAGGSGERGTGALGVTWTTQKCYDFKGGANWIALGEYEAACHLWADVHRDAFKRQHYQPDCKAIAARLTEEAERARRVGTATQYIPEDVVTRRELNETVDRVAKKALSK